MLQINDYVVFGSTGVCQVTDITRENFGGSSEREYYSLSPLYVNSSTIYVPTDNKSVKIRKVLTSAEIAQVIQKMPEIACDWIPEDQPRRLLFGEMLQSGDPYKLVELIKIIHARKTELTALNKRLAFSDEEIIKSAEKLLYHEFALVLDIKPEQVVPFILGQLSLS